MNAKAIIIGSTPTYRGEYSNVAVYYKENVVSYYSCVFKAAANNFSSIPPIVVDSEGYISIANTAAWLCVVDNTRLYNLALQYKQIKLKTINNESLFGEGNIVVEGGGGGTPITIDSRLSASSHNPVENRIITGALQRVEELLATNGGNAVAVTYWQSTVPAANVDGQYFYNTSTNTLYVCEKSESEVSGRWVAESPSSTKLYVNSNSSDWCKWNGNKMVGVGLGKVSLSKLDDFTDNSIANADAPPNYIVTNEGQASVGLLTMYSDTDKNALVQIFDTNLVLGSDNTFDTSSFSVDKTNRYFRVYGLSQDGDVEQGEWTDWKTSTFTTDVDTEFSESSENPIANRTVTGKISELEEMIGDIEKDVFYFYGYADIPIVTLESVEFTGESGKITYLVQQNMFALKVDDKYYQRWSETESRLSSEWYNKEEDGSYVIRTDKVYCLVGEEETDPFFKIDDELSITSGNVVSNKAITKRFQDISELHVTITQITAKDNGQFECVCNQSIRTIRDNFIAGRTIIISESSYFNAYFKVLQVPYVDDKGFCGVMVSNNIIYSFVMEGSILTFRPYKLESGVTEELQSDVDTMRNINILAYVGSDSSEYTKWEVGNYWYDTRKISSTAAAMTFVRLKKCVKVVSNVPTFEDETKVTPLMYVESVSSIKLYLWIGKAMFLLSNNPIELT